ncbi:hypothetical protein [Serratia fonticola]|uniref:hypothetical protein n=1 Tax=Serratia fonticola TaxID=47917 RepID=UPI000463C6AB|nr:hypothetical protein [Serratia fonticola]
MNTNKTTLFFVLYAMTTTIIVGLISLFGAQHFFLRESLNIVCTSNYFAPSLPENMSMRGTMTVHLGKNNKGTINISGILEKNQEIKTHQKSKKVILREVSFDYVVEDKGYITINNPNISHSASDKVPDDFFNLHVFDLSRTSRQLKVMRVNDAWLFGTSFSPVIMCVNKT